MASDDRGRNISYQLEHGIKLAQYLINILKDRIDPHSQWGNLANQAFQELYITLAGLQNGIATLENEQTNARALIETAYLLNSSLDFDHVLDAVMDTIISLSGAQRGYLMLKDAASQGFNIKVARNLDRKTIDGREFEISRSIIQRVAENGEAILTTNAQEDSRFSMEDSIVSYNLLSILCVPLKYKNELTGIIYTDNKIHAGLFTPDTLNLVNGFANQAAIAIENARLFKDLKETLAEIQGMKSLLDNVLSSIASGVITLETNGSIEYVNLSASRILETPPRKLTHHELSTAIPELAERIKPFLDRLTASRETLSGLNMVLHKKSGLETALKVSISPLQNQMDEISGSVIVFDDVTEALKRELQLAGVKHYLPAEMIDGIESPDSLRLGGTRRDISILFADIRGFSSFSEHVDPEFLVEIINRYMMIAAEAIHHEGGIIDKFMGDSVLALYNTPLRKQEDHAQRAIKSALKMRRDLAAYNSQVDESLRLEFGIGIHRGDALVGNIGCPEHLEYTAMGDAVNIAKRLQESAKANQILISESLLNDLPERARSQPLGDISLKGREQRISVFEINEA